MRFLLDHCISVRVCRAINVLAPPGGIPISPLKEHFPTDITDAAFLTKLRSDSSWAIISQDLGLPAESARLQLACDHGCIIFVLDGKWGNKSRWEKAAQLIGWWPFLQPVAIPLH